MQQTSALTIPVVLIGLALLMALWIGLFLLIRGLRGVAIDDHPVCRRCGFDLFGRPQGVDKCSECGADLTQPKAIRIGNRRRRAAMSWVGGFLLLIAMGGLGMVLIGIANDIEWIKYEPTWYVVRQSQNTTAADRDPALKELLRRLSAGELPDERIKQIVDDQLVWQADANTAWVPERGDLIDSAHTAGKVPADKWSQYLARAVQFKLVARPKVRRGDQVPVRLVQTADRSGSRTQLQLYTTTNLEDDTELAAKKQYFFGGRNGSGSVGRNGTSSTGSNLVLDPTLVAAASDGTKNLHITLKAEIYDHQNPADKEPATATKDVDLKTTWDLVPADAVTVKKIDDNSVTAAVEKSIKINDLSVNAQDPNYVHASINFSAPPVALACKVILRAGDREWPAGNIYLVKGQNSGWGTGAQVKDFDANVVDVIFRPDERTALDTIDMTEYWAGEAVIKNVKVTRLGK